MGASRFHRALGFIILPSLLNKRQMNIFKPIVFYRIEIPALKEAKSPTESQNKSKDLNYAIC